MGQSDVLLLQNTGGTACPALFRFITVSATGLRATPEFGTCSEIIYPTFNEKTGVTVAMVGFSGSSEPAAEQRKAAMTKTIYRLQPNGQLTENGKPVR